MTNELLPIRSVAELTGVNSMTLRAWERRYGLVKPQRTASGHRLYSHADIVRIKEILAWLAKGVSVSQVKQLLDIPSEIAKTSTTGIWQQYLQQMHQQIADFNLIRLDQIYNEALSLYPIDIVTEQLLLPLLLKLKDSTQRKPGDTAKQRFFSVFIRNKLGTRFHHANLHCDGPKIIFAGLTEMDCEFELMFLALYLLAHGYQAIFLGINIPIEELFHVIIRTNSCALIVAGTLTKEIFNQLLSLEQTTAKPIFIKSVAHTKLLMNEQKVIPLKSNFYAALKQIRAILK